MEFNYSIYAKGMGYSQFHCQFKNDNLLSLEQIKFIVHCKMTDAGIKGIGFELELLSVSIRSTDN